LNIEQRYDGVTPSKQKQIIPIDLFSREFP